MSKTKPITCPCCERVFDLPISWWNDQPTNITECPLCLAPIMIDVEELNAVSLREYLKSNYKRYSSGSSNKPFFVRERDLISYIDAESWPNV